MNTKFKDYSKAIYDDTFNNVLKTLSKSSKKSDKSIIERAAQKEAIKCSILKTMGKFPDIEPTLIWRGIYEIHVHRKSGIDNAETISRVIRADQSWKKSSGHAFEEIINLLANSALNGTGIEIVLQRDLNMLIREKVIANEPRDVSWLKEQIKGSVFDLFVIMKVNDQKFCFGCIQSKTSIRDRVTRDREPSLAAMQSFFWSTIIVLDGDFLKLPKFTSMVTGGSTEYPENGWHGMYVFSNNITGDRIYPLHINFKKFADHAIKAADYWQTQRQWFNKDWKAE